MKYRHHLTVALVTCVLAGLAQVSAQTSTSQPSAVPSSRPTLPPRFATTQLTLQTFTLAPKADNPAHPILVHLPGISGYLGADRSLLRGLRAAGLSGPIEILNWPNYAPGLTALVSLDANREQAKRVTKYLTTLAADNPGRPIVITCHSGGSGIVAWALEALPRDVMIERVIFLAPALSPGFDLSPALAHVRVGAFVFSSTNDILLDKMTPVFGTIDRVLSKAAGYTGFVEPPHPAIAGEYVKLHTLQYTTDWLTIGNNGDHVGPLMTPFVKAYVAGILWPPLIVAATTRPSK